MKQLDDFTRAYIECALWSSVDSESEKLSARYTIEDFSPEAVKKMENDCVCFRAENAEDLRYARYNNPEYKAGHDFWLTRNGHGAGFWDTNLPEELGNRLAEAARVFGECYIEEHRGKLYVY